MREPFLIPGRTLGETPSSQLPAAPRGSRLLRFFFVIWLLAGIGFLGVKMQSGRSKPVENTVQPKHQTLTAISTEDLLHHMDNVNVRLANAAAKIRRAEDQIARALPSVERNYLLVEKRQLENAMDISEAGRRDLEQSRQDCELILNSLRKEHELK